MDIKITFEAAKLPFYFVSLKGGRKTLEVQAFDGGLTVSVQYDFDRRPLSLNGEIKEGDRVEVILMAHRIELYIGGELKDEEWPAGERLFAPGDGFWPSADVCVSEYREEEKVLPCVLSSFQNAEGWYPGGGVFVGDCMPYEKDGEYHVLYLKDRHHHQSKWGLGGHQWDHISTKDFETWFVHPMAVPITDPKEGSVCTGSWIRDEEREYLFYTIRMGGRIPAPIRRSISTDGYHFTRDKDFGFSISETKYHNWSARDPKIVRGEDGVFHMFLTTSLRAVNRGCLAHFVSRDLENWEDFGEPIYVSPNSDQPECPDYFEYKGKYYLVYSLRGTAHYAVSDQPFDGFKEPAQSVIPCESVPKGALWKDSIVFVGFRRMGGYAGAMTFLRATAKEDGELVFIDKNEKI